MIDLNDDEKAQIAKADAMEADAKAIRDAAYAARDAREMLLPLEDRLTFAAYVRCPCGHGMAHDRLSPGDPNSPFKGPAAGYWDCSAIILGIADPTLKHEAKLPFAFYEIKSENQPSAKGATTRVPAAPREQVAS